jgi:hypothetical protein
MKIKLNVISVLFLLSSFANAADSKNFQAKRNLFSKAYEPFIEEIAGKSWNCTSFKKDGTAEKIPRAVASTNAGNIMLKSEDKKGKFNWGIVYLYDDASGLTVNTNDLKIRNHLSKEMEGYKVQRILRQTETLDLIEEVVVSVNDAKVAARNKKLREDKDPMIKSLYAIVQSQKGPKSLGLVSGDGEVAFYTHCKAVK